MKSSFSKTLFPIILVLLTALVCVGIFFQLRVRNVLTEQIMDELDSNATALSELASAYCVDGKFISEAFVVNLTVADKVSGTDSVICDASGNLLICSDAPLGCSHQNMTINEKYLNKILSHGSLQSTGIVEGLYSQPRHVMAKTILDQGKAVGIVIVSTPMTQTNLVLNKMARIFVTVSILVILASIVIMVIYLRRQSAPLRAMAKAAKDFGHGNFDARVHVDEHCSEEVQELGLAFNNMAASLQKSEYQRQEFVANVSHELKTPMTTISGFVDGILDGTIPPQRQEHYMMLVSQETKRLSRLVRSMLEISRLQDQGGIPEEKKTRFDMTESLGQVLITFERKILERDLQVQVDMPDHPVFTRADQDAITQVIYNLMDNAVKFCPNGGKLSVKLCHRGSKIYVTVSNEGHTIPAQELPLLFDRFHKLDKSRSKNRDGWGLGLYIVKTILDSHGENISASSKEGVTEFNFTLPFVN